MNNIRLVIYIIYGSAVCLGYAQVMRQGYRLGALWSAPRSAMGLGTSHHK